MIRTCFPPPQEPPVFAHPPPHQKLLLFVFKAITCSSAVTDQLPRVSSNLSLQAISRRFTDEKLVSKEHKITSSWNFSRGTNPRSNPRSSEPRERGREKRHLSRREHDGSEEREAKQLKREQERKFGSMEEEKEEATRSFPARGGGSGIESKYGHRLGKALENQAFDVERLRHEERRQLLENIEQAAAVVLTLVYQDGSSQLKPDKSQTGRLGPSTANTAAEDELDGRDRHVFLGMGPSSKWGQEGEANDRFSRKVLFQILKCASPVICFNAKDFLRTVLQSSGREITWKQVASCAVFDPRIAAWLLDPKDAAPCFEDLVAKYFGKSTSVRTEGENTDSSPSAVEQNLCANLKILYRLTMDLCTKLQVCGLWRLFHTLELPLIPILAVMESQKIQVNQEELRRTSELLGVRLTELEQQAHFQAGERFLLTSSHQLREILYDKFKLHLLCKSKPLPRTQRRKYPSTSEAALNALRDLHPLPKIILECKGVHKMKSTFVDGLLACMKEGFISPTWNQTGTVSGRLSAKQPNIQGISRHPIQITRRQNVRGKEEDEIVTISPRSMFVSAKGCVFLAADFSQVELRILAHLSRDPQLLGLFREPESADVFASLASQWKGRPLEEVKPEEREQAKRVVYSAVYGAGKERLAACLDVTPLQAGRFIESFLQKYKKVHDFTQETIAQCHRKGFVASVMGRTRPLANINAVDATLRAQAERQAVNFAVQGSAADLCKLAMIEIFKSISISPTLSARKTASPAARNLFSEIYIVTMADIAVSSEALLLLLGDRSPAEGDTEASVTQQATQAAAVSGLTEAACQLGSQKNSLKARCQIMRQSRGLWGKRCSLRPPTQPGTGRTWGAGRLSSGSLPFNSQVWKPSTVKSSDLCGEAKRRGSKEAGKQKPSIVKSSDLCGNTQRGREASSSSWTARNVFGNRKRKHYVLENRTCDFGPNTLSPSYVKKGLSPKDTPCPGLVRSTTRGRNQLSLNQIRLPLQARIQPTPDPSCGGSQGMHRQPSLGAVRDAEAKAKAYLELLVAQIHDELLFEVEDSQVLEFSGLSRPPVSGVWAQGRELKWRSAKLKGFELSSSPGEKDDGVPAAH
ncbi:DNA polymerase nu [Tachyglossus aculeatus]|uniref:DNA polymerase nu n=1 Tax=Tachyglossus aculeatus TaxID=9261 RepID=UPI0018F2FAB9|nr:DNA polymerase nu [Tachyglossus aculeatus]